jgi:hypothetical protein
MGWSLRSEWANVPLEPCVGIALTFFISCPAAVLLLFHFPMKPPGLA